MGDLIPLPPLPPGPEPAVARELDEAILVGTLDDSDAAPAAVRAWYPSSDSEAEWCMRKLAALQAREDAIVAQHAEWRAPIDAWQKAERDRLAPAVGFFQTRLQTYALARRAEDPKGGKTTRLPSGSVATRGGEDPKVVVADEDAVIAWAQGALTGAEYEAVVKETAKVQLTGLRAVVVVREKPPLLPAEEWQAVTGVYVADADVGWRGENFLEWDTPIDRDDFLLRASLSTVEPLREPSGWEPPMGYVVVQVATGEVVPGVELDWPEVTATIKVDR